MKSLNVILQISWLSESFATLFAIQYWDFLQIGIDIGICSDFCGPMVNFHMLESFLRFFKSFITEITFYWNSFLMLISNVLGQGI